MSVNCETVKKIMKELVKAYPEYVTEENRQTGYEDRGIILSSKGMDRR